jgi:hypothetical protein
MSDANLKTTIKEIDNGFEEMERSFFEERRKFSDYDRTYSFYSTKKSWEMVRMHLERLIGIIT